MRDTPGKKGWCTISCADISGVQKVCTNEGSNCMVKKYIELSASVYVINSRVLSERVSYLNQNRIESLAIPC